MIPMNRGSAKLDQRIPDWLIGREVKFTRALVSEVSCRGPACLQTIRTYDLAAWPVLDDQVVAGFVKFVGVAPRFVGRLQPLVQLQVEHQKPETECGFQVFSAFRKPQLVYPAGQGRL